MKIKRLGVFAFEDEIATIKTLAAAPLISFGGGQRLGESAHEAAHRIAISHGLPEISGYYGIDLQTGEFVVELE